MGKERVISPRFREVPTGPVESRGDAAQRRFVAGGNTSHLYSHVYKSIFGGRVAQLDNGYTTVSMPWDETRYFRPDIVKDTKNGKKYTEIKAVSTRTSQPHCSIPQFEDYAFFLLYGLAIGDSSPSVDYALFRYGDRNLTGQHSLSNDSLASKLANETRDLVVLPSNLAMFLFLNMRQKIYNQSSSASTINQRAYWDVRSSDLNLLHNHSPLDAIEKIMAHSLNMTQTTRRNKNAMIDNLFLDRLSVERKKSPEISLGRKQRLKTFPITRYKLSARDQKEWNDHFLREHERILGSLGVRDLYAEIGEEVEQVDFNGCGEVPF
ncbi:MAG: hypothetical protein AABY10_03270 [Nanoarchaeota archaeon]